MSTLNVTIIQSDVHWEDKEKNLRMFEDKILNLQEASHIVILPEMFSTGFSMQPEKFAEKMNGETVRWMQMVSSKRKSIITGSVIIEEEGKYYNRLIWVLPNGTVGFYNKRHLFGYAGETACYTPGSNRFITSVNGWKILLIVCYDLRFPVWTRQQVADGTPEYDLIICVASWPDRRIDAWKILLQARAIENQCFTIGVNRVGMDGNKNYYSGDSMIVDPTGKILYTKSDKEDTCTMALDRKIVDDIRNKLPFLSDADTFQIIN